MVARPPRSAAASICRGYGLEAGPGEEQASGDAAGHAPPPDGGGIASRATGQPACSIIRIAGHQLYGIPVPSSAQTHSAFRFPIRKMGKDER